MQQYNIGELETAVSTAGSTVEFCEILKSFSCPAEKEHMDVLANALGTDGEFDEELLQSLECNVLLIHNNKIRLRISKKTAKLTVAMVTAYKKLMKLGE